MPKKTLTEYLIAIGKETSDTVQVDIDGTHKPITNDEALARLIWKQANGYIESDENEDGTGIRRVHSPDPRMQQFIFERREGKVVESLDDKQITILEKMSELTRMRMNRMAEDAAKNDKDDNPTDA